MNDDWKDRLTNRLEPVLRQADPRVHISAYHDMPYAIFRYPAEEEFALRREIALLRTRLEQAGKRVVTVSLADCMQEALEAEGMNPANLAEAERKVGLETTLETIHQILAEYRPLVDIVAARNRPDSDPFREVVFLVRAGALFPVYRTSSLLEQLKGKCAVPTVLFYPGVLDGAAGLKFMGVLEAEHNYRPRIF